MTKIGHFRDWCGREDSNRRAVSITCAQYGSRTAPKPPFETQTDTSVAPLPPEANFG